MKSAWIFNEKEPKKVFAKDVLTWEDRKKYEFIDLEYEFKVTFVKSSKNNGEPYFRLYLSKKDYDKLSKEKQSIYDQLAKMRHYKESKWHREWKNKLSTFSEIEKAIKNTKKNKYKIADAFYEKNNTCIELQHSFIKNDFETRNLFYKEMDINIIWLYDLTDINVKSIGNNEYEILENNSNPFFKIERNKNNILDWPVFIQAKNKKIYRIERLSRKNTSNELESTIRYFEINNVYSEEEFISRIKSNRFIAEYLNYNLLSNIEKVLAPNYEKIIVKKTNEKEQDNIFLIKCENGVFLRDYEGRIEYQYVSLIKNGYKLHSKDYYKISNKSENMKIWQLLKKIKI